MSPLAIAGIVFLILMVAFLFGLCSIAHQVDNNMPGYSDYVAEEMRRGD